MNLATLHPRDLRSFVSGGGEAMRALERRIASGTGDMSMELYQLADPATANALVARARTGASVHVLGDARLAKGGLEAELQAATASGSWHTYGDGDRLWQHAKTYHFAEATGPETWLTNLAPIPDTTRRTELSIVIAGDAAEAARDVTRATIAGDRAGVQGAIDAAAAHGVLYNDPLHGRARLMEGVLDVIERRDDRLLVVTKGIQSDGMTDALVAAHRAGRDVRVLVRDIARHDAQRLESAGVPTWIVSGGLKPRVNGLFAGDRAIIGSAFLWDNMMGSGEGVRTARDAGVALSGAPARAARAATLEMIDAMPRRTPIADALRAGTLPHYI